MILPELERRPCNMGDPARIVVQSRKAELKPNLAIQIVSLVPHLHIAILRADRLYDTLRQAMIAQNWLDGMPTNALLISGPSKTSDIEQTLAYGVHGPRRLVVLIVG